MHSHATILGLGIIAPRSRKIYRASTCKIEYVVEGSEAKVGAGDIAADLRQDYHKCNRSEQCGLAAPIGPTNEDQFARLVEKDIIRYRALFFPVECNNWVHSLLHKE